MVWRYGNTGVRRGSVRGVPAKELYDLVPFTVHSLVRPMTMELLSFGVRRLRMQITRGHLANNCRPLNSSQILEHRVQRRLAEDAPCWEPLPLPADSSRCAGRFYREGTCIC